jgi:mRNA-degrading endonuclease toxin of MazEF toxin-antitoxin module
MKCGELFWVELPDRGGREQRGRRPAVIWQDTDAFHLPTVLIVPLTTKLDVLRLGSTVLVHPSTSNGLTAPSAALVFQMGACDVRRFGSRLGVLEASDLGVLQAMAKKLQKLS